MKVHVITQNIQLAEWMRDLVQRRILRALYRFAHRVAEAVVTFEDLNGPRGGMDVQCRLRLLLHPRGEINVSAVEATAYLALRDATQRAKRLVKTPSFEWKRNNGGKADRFQIRGSRLRP